MSKIFFFDIDGTLAMRGMIPEGNLEMLDDLKAKGYKTFICTGRVVSYAKKLFGQHVTGYIGCNGRYIDENNECLYGKSFSEEELNNLISRFKALKIGYTFAAKEITYYENLSEEEEINLHKQYGDKVKPLSECNEPLYTFDLFFEKYRLQELIDYFKGEIILNDHHNGSADCTTVSFDKGSAIKYLLEYYHIDHSDSYAFGDGYNDVYMFRETDNRIAMGNAVDVLKEKATYITDDYDKQGIQKALAYYKI